MYHEQLITHISKRRSSGISDLEIRTELQQDKWNDKDIDLAFYYVDHPEKVTRFSISRILKSEVKESTLLIVILLGTISFLVYFFFFRNNIISYELIAPTSTSSSTPLTYGVQSSLSNPDYFAKVKNQFIEEKVTFVEVDLSQMIARVYRDGTPVLEVPVKTKGKEGSWWETPAGLYKIETREKSHYSTMGHVTQPWSMQFQGNFFIHGWPKYDDGTPVSSTFSGGCIRLADIDAKKIFDEVTVGTPILVYEKDFIPDTFSYISPKPKMEAPQYMIADIMNNQVLLNQNENKQIPVGAITKLMTALIATEYINIEKTTTVPKTALVETEVPRLKAGMKIDVYQLLFPLLRESSNESAETIARLYGRESFIKHMNEKAKAIGMTRTTFVDPTGISEGNLSTASDIFMLTKYIYNNRSFLFNITSGKVKTTTYGPSIFTNLGEANSLANHDSFFGGIDATTDASGGLNLSVFELTIAAKVRPVFFLSIGSQHAGNDVTNAVEYIKSYYK